MEKIALFDIQSLATKYGVEIDISFGKTYKITVSNGTEIESFYGSFDNIVHDKIIKIAKDMRIKELKRQEEIKEHLQNIDVSIFPDKLF